MLKIYKYVHNFLLIILRNNVIIINKDGDLL